MPYIGKSMSRKVITGFQAVSITFKCSWESAWAAPARPISHRMCHTPFHATRSFTGVSLTAKQLTRRYPSTQNNSSPNTVLYISLVKKLAYTSQQGAHASCMTHETQQLNPHQVPHH